MNGWMDRCMDGGMDKRMDVWIDDRFNNQGKDEKTYSSSDPNNWRFESPD